MKRIIRAMWFIFWNYWGWFVIVMPLVMGALTFVMLVMFTPVIFTFPYSIEEIGAAAAGVLMMSTTLWVLIWVVLGIFTGVDIPGYIDEVKWIAGMQDADDAWKKAPCPTSSSGEKR